MSTETILPTIDTPDVPTPSTRTLLLQAARLTLILTVLTGVLYPLAVLVLAQGIFPANANGSLIRADDTVIGSSLIGQAFDDPRYFWGRPSFAGGSPYNAAASSGANLGTNDPRLVEAVQARLDALRAADPDNTAPVPLDLITASASGLDPHISPAAALYQAPRIARERGLTLEQVQALVTTHIEPRELLIWGEPRVNVLALNLALDALQP